jgi:hypothetical protein
MHGIVSLETFPHSGKIVLLFSHKRSSCKRSKQLKLSYGAKNNSVVRVLMCHYNSLVLGLLTLCTN